MLSQNNISNYVSHSRNYLVHTGENVSMVFSKILLYDAGVIFICLFKVDRLQMIVVAKKKIYLCCNCSSVGCLKCVQFYNWFRLH